MQLGISLEEVFKLDEQGFIVCSGKQYHTVLKKECWMLGLTNFTSIIETFGALSAKSQKLGQIITTMPKFTNSNDRIYIKTDLKLVQGFVRVGEKSLFHREPSGHIHEIKPTCVLDIYVHESCQRSGIGKEIFQKMLKVEHKEARSFAYDRPSDKMMGFLKKHYDLWLYLPQNNNYVIFQQFFQNIASKPQSKKPSVLQNRYFSRQRQRQITQNQKIAEQKVIQAAKNENQPPMSYREYKVDMDGPRDSIDQLRVEADSRKPRVSGNVQEKVAVNLNWFWPSSQKNIFRPTSHVYGSYYGSYGSRNRF